MKRHRWLLGCLVLGLILCAPVWADEDDADEQEIEITLEELPEAVRAALEREAPGASIEEIERETENGETEYEVEVVIDGVEVELEFAPDGTLLEREEGGEDEEDEHEEEGEDDDDEDEGEEESITLDQLPEAVRAALEREVPGAVILEIEVEEEEGQIEYEIVAASGGEKAELDFSPDGTLLEREEERGDIIFEHEIDPLGSLPPGLTPATTNGGGAVGDWEVMQGPEVPSRTHVIGLVNPNHDRGGAFNILWTDQVEFSDGEVDVWVRAREGVEDQGGGPIWRVQDADNYYICRWNPLENNFRVYVVSGGNRRTLASASTTASAESWHEIRAAHVGSHIVCWLDGEPMLEADDDTIESPGGVGLWTKADAITAFDGLTVSTRPRLDDDDEDDDDDEEEGADHDDDEENEDEDDDD